MKWNYKCILKKKQKQKKNLKETDKKQNRKIIKKNGKQIKNK